jgi:hypothetical protein
LVGLLLLSGCAPSLHGSIRSLDEPSALELIATSPQAELNRRSGGRTPLASAVASCNPRIVKALLDRGVEVDLADDEGRTPLMATCSQKNVDRDPTFEILLSLLDAGASPNSKDERGFTALEWADPGARVWLLERGVGPGGIYPETLDAFEFRRAANAQMITAQYVAAENPASARVHYIGALTLSKAAIDAFGALEEEERAQRAAREADAKTKTGVAGMLDSHCFVRAATCGANRQSQLLTYQADMNKANSMLRPRGRRAEIRELEGQVTFLELAIHCTASGSDDVCTELEAQKIRDAEEAALVMAQPDGG